MFGKARWYLDVREDDTYNAQPDENRGVQIPLVHKESNLVAKVEDAPYQPDVC